MRISKNSRYDWGSLTPVILPLFRHTDTSEFFEGIPGLETFLKKEKIAGKTGKEVLLRQLNPNRWTLLTGVGPGEEANEARKLAKRIIQRLRQDRIEEAAVCFGSKTRLSRSFYGNLIDYLHLNHYQFSNYKKEKPGKVRKLILVSIDPAAPSRINLARSEAISRTVDWVRDQVNEIPSIMNPDMLCTAFDELSRDSRLSLEILRRKELEAGDFRGILAVGDAGCCEPALAVFRYTPDRFDHCLALVGKGVTFDSGGLNIKTGSSMSDMKCDMAGAAVVGGVMRAASLLEIPVKMIGVVPLVENMPGRSAYKQGDVIRFRNGKNVEIVNTDAEGRLILADALIEAVRHRPDWIVEFSTLTGAIVTALGDSYAGLMCRNRRLASLLTAAGKATGEFLWELPLFSEYRESIKSRFADLKNADYRGGSSIKAGLFLQEFTGTVPYAHIDIAGTAFLARPNHYFSDEGATGFGVRLMIDFLGKIGVKKDD